MNERIQALAEQAKANVPAGLVVDKWIECYNEEYARLIVQECAKFLEENSGHDAANNAWHPEPEDLLKHFGL